MRLGIQTYTVRDEMDKDFVGTLRALKELGYEGAELCHFYGYTGAQVREIFEQLNLDLISVSFGMPESVDSEYLAEIAAAGCKYAVISWTAPELRRGTEKYEKTIEVLKQLTEECDKLGLTLLYHNHDFEFEKHDGTYDYDDMMERVPALGAEPDAGWLRAAGQSPVKFLERYAGRVGLLHAKDLEGSIHLQTLQYRAVGEGSVEWDSVLDAAAKAGAEWVVVEQDLPECGRTAMECAAISLQYLKGKAH